MKWMLTLAMLVAAAGANAVDPPVVPCESMGSRVECRVAPFGKIALRDERSESLCIEGVTWGTSQPGVVWVDRDCRATFTILPADVAAGMRVVCESDGGRTRCPADLAGGVTLVEQLSTFRCLEGETWGTSDDGEAIWVDGGCRAIFALDRSSRRRADERLEATVRCESSGAKRVDCRANTGGGVQLVRLLGDAECRFARSWGYDARGVWVSNGCRAEFAVRRDNKPVARAITCESSPGRTQRCEADGRPGVALVRQLGDVPCVQGRTWDFTDSEVWVSDGCRGQFALGGFRLAAAAVPPGASRVLCESKDGGRRVCEVGANRGVGLLEEKSDDACVLNRTWGYGGGELWVDRGCRAEFVVAR